MRIYSIFIFILLLSACGKTVLMKNEATGETQACEVDALDDALGGFWATRRDIKACVNTLEKAGYKKVK